MKLIKLIETFLTDSQICRNNDQKLMLRVWEWQCINEVGVHMNQLSAYNFTYLLTSGQIAAPETIARTRRLLQQQKPYLRGKSYLTRQAKQDTIKAKIKQYKAATNRQSLEDLGQISYLPI